jgi:hypothetical protein
MSGEFRLEYDTVDGYNTVVRKIIDQTVHNVHK